MSNYLIKLLWGLWIWGFLFGGNYLVASYEGWRVVFSIVGLGVATYWFALKSPFLSKRP